MSRSADQRTFSRARASRVLNKAPERHARDPHHFLRDLTILTGIAQTGGNNFTRISLLWRCYFSRLPLPSLRTIINVHACAYV